MSTEEHERESARAAADRPPHPAVITVSDTRTIADDHSGDCAIAALNEVGWTDIHREIVPDEPARIESALDELLAEGRVDSIILLGGTGIGPRDGTPDVVQRRLDLELPGFGEQVRAIGMRDVGPSAILSRAVGGVIHAGNERPVMVFVLPGSVKAAESIVREIIVPLLPHALWEARGRR